MSAQKKVTIYSGGGMFGITRYEAKLVAHGTKPYAQYEAAPFVHFVEKGKRTTRGIVQGYAPFILILDGHGHPEPDEGFVDADISNTGMTCRRSRYASCDPRYQTDFNSLISGYLDANPGLVVADYRHSKAVAV